MKAWEVFGILLSAEQTDKNECYDDLNQDDRSDQHGTVGHSFFQAWDLSGEHGEVRQIESDNDREEDQTAPVDPPAEDAVSNFQEKRGHRQVGIKPQPKLGLGDKRGHLDVPCVRYQV